jgi:hypothetical protein
MNEREFTHTLVDRLQSKLTNLEVKAGKSLIYSLSINQEGDIPLQLNQQGEPMRGDTDFELDVLAFQCVPGKTSIVPRVAIEVKFGSVTTHDAIAYSAKAEKIRSVYPYLRYGLVLGDLTVIPPRVLRLGLEFDFMVRISNPLGQEEMDRLINLLAEEVETSRKLGVMFSGANVTTFRKRYEIEPHIDLTPLAKELVNKPSISRLAVSRKDLSEVSYYVYENFATENKAKIHYGYCKYCNYGKGIHPVKGESNSRWHGPFSSYFEAEEAAKDTGRMVSVCRLCKPE